MFCCSVTTCVSLSLHTKLSEGVTPINDNEMIIGGLHCFDTTFSHTNMYCFFIYLYCFVRWSDTTYADLLPDVFVHICIGSDVNILCPEPNLIFIWLYKLKLLYNMTHVFLPCPQTSYFIPVRQLFILYTVLHDIKDSIHCQIA